MPKKKLISFLCDAGPKVGFGHLIRCCELALSLKKLDRDLECHFFGSYSKESQAILLNKGFSGKSLEYLQEEGFFFIDKYQLPTSFYESLNAKKIPWFAFADDATQYSQNALGIVNFRLEAEKHYSYAGSKNTWLGVTYFPFSESLIPIREANLSKEQKIETILICLGGVDLFSLSEKFSVSIQKMFPKCKIETISPNTKEIRKEGNITIYPLQTSLSPFFEKADLAISGGGRIKYELAFCGVPSLIASQVPVQDEDTQIFVKNDLCWDLGCAETLSKKEKILNLEESDILSFQKSMLEKSKTIFNKESSLHLAKVIKNQWV